MSDVENLKKLAKALDSIVEVGEEIMSDGKVDFNDAPSAIKLAQPAKDIYDAFQAKDAVVEELKVWLQAKIDELTE